MLLVFVACGAASDTGGDPARGAVLFRGDPNAPVGSFTNCSECHSVVAGEPVVLGPNLAGIALRAGSTVPEQDAETYLRNAILQPDAYLSGGFQEGIMPRTYAKDFSEAEVADLIAYLMTLSE